MEKLSQVPNRPSSSVSQGMGQEAEAQGLGQAPIGWEPGAAPYCVFITCQVPPWACLPLVLRVVSVLPDQEMKSQQIKRPARDHRRAGCSRISETTLSHTLLPRTCQAGMAPDTKRSSPGCKCVLFLTLGWNNPQLRAAMGVGSDEAVVQGCHSSAPPCSTPGTLLWAPAKAPALGSAQIRPPLFHCPSCSPTSLPPPQIHLIQPQLPG